MCAAEGGGGRMLSPHVCAPQYARRELEARTHGAIAHRVTCHAQRHGQRSHADQQPSPGAHDGAAVGKANPEAACASKRGRGGSTRFVWPGRGRPGQRHARGPTRHARVGEGHACIRARACECECVCDAGGCASQPGGSPPAASCPACLPFQRTPQPLALLPVIESSTLMALIVTATLVLRRRTHTNNKRRRGVGRGEGGGAPPLLLLRVCLSGFFCVVSATQKASTSTVRGARSAWLAYHHRQPR